MPGYSTRQALALINTANPDLRPRNDDHVRAAIRRDKVPAPALRFAGRYLWSPAEVALLAEALGRCIPAHDLGTTAGGDGQVGGER